MSLGDFHEPKIIEQHYSGVYFLSEETQYLKPIIEHWCDYPEILEAEINNEELRRVECSGDRSGYLIYQSDKKYKI